MREEKQEPLLSIREAIKQKEGLSFQYRRPDGRVTRHNAVYPRKIYNGEQHILGPTAILPMMSAHFA